MTRKSIVARLFILKVNECVCPFRRADYQGRLVVHFWRLCIAISMFKRQVDSLWAGRLIEFDNRIRWLIFYKCFRLRLLKLIVVHTHGAIIHHICINSAFHGLIFVEAFAAMFGVQLLQDRFNVLMGHCSLHFVKVLVVLLSTYLCEWQEAAASQVVILVVVWVVREDGARLVLPRIPRALLSKISAFLNQFSKFTRLPTRLELWYVLGAGLVSKQGRDAPMPQETSFFWLILVRKESTSIF